MKNKNLKRICSLLLSAVLALTLVFNYVRIGGAEEEDNPTLSFQNEKYDGIRVFKNIYSNEEYYKEMDQLYRDAFDNEAELEWNID